MKYVVLSLLVLGSLVLAGCTSKPAAVVYDANSWKEVIDMSCQSFFDGCNQCMKMPGSDEAACTRMFCETYAEPYCIDQEGAVEVSPVVDDLTSVYVGLSLEDAMMQAEANDTLFRVIELDGEPLPATMDLRPGRINATVEDGIVVSIQVE